MAIEPQELENLESFLKGTLSGAEAKALKQKLKEDQAFFDEAKSYAKLIHVLEQADPNRARVKALVKAEPTPSTSKMLLLRPVLAIAATLTILIVALVWVTFNWQTHKSKEALSLGFEIELNPKGSKGAMRSKAEQMFFAGEFLPSAKLFDAEYQQNKADLQLRYNYAVASLKAGDLKEAQIVFKELITLGYNDYQRAELYLAASLFLAGKREESKEILLAILEEEDHLEQKNAQILLNKIEKK